MRKVIVMLFMLLVCVGLFLSCSTKKKEDSMIEFDSGEFFNKEWAEDVGTYKGDIIPNMDVAVEVAKDIFDGIPKNPSTVGYVPLSVFYDEPDGIWIVTFGEKSMENIVGGDCSIALQKSDGKVLRIWFGE